jgi:hypothetical protein
MAASEPSAPEPRDFRASIRSFVDRDLTFCHLDDGYELRHEGLALGWVGESQRRAPARAATRDGAWWFDRLRGGGIEVSERLDGPVIARYDSKLLPGGVIELPDGVRLRLRPPIIGETWRVRRGIRELIMELREPWKPWLVRLTDAARDVYHLPLLTMLAFSATLVEMDRPGGPAVAADGGGGLGI